MANTFDSRVVVEAEAYDAVLADIARGEVACKFGTEGRHLWIPGHTILGPSCFHCMGIQPGSGTIDIERYFKRGP